VSGATINGGSKGARAALKTVGAQAAMASTEPFGVPDGTLLRGFERYQTADPEVAEGTIASFLSPHRLTIHGETRRFAATGRVAEVGALSLCLMSYGEEVIVDRPVQDDRYVAVLIPVQGRLLVRLRGMEFVATPSESIAVLSQRERVNLRWSKDCRIMTVRADAAALQAALAELSPRLSGSSLKLESAQIVGLRRQAVLGVAANLVQACSSCGSDGLPRFLIRRLSEQALTTLLLTLDHNETDTLFRPLEPVTGRSVRAAMDLVHDEVRAEHTVHDLAGQLGVTVRTLELAFRKELDTTPNAYLQRVRLDRARAELRHGDCSEGTTVTDVAMKWGFAHVGRFAKRYRDAFGVAPSADLRAQFN